jgi:4-deoxy-L-threo-5-hexosulose-uronate ketol-isomerase
MKILESIDSKTAKKFDTEDLRKNFLCTKLFEQDKANLVYSYYDRLIIGGIVPVKKELSLDIDKGLIGGDYLLERREMGIINTGGNGTIKVDGKEYNLEKKDCLYIGMGAKDISFKSADSSNPAKFYINSAPAHVQYPTVHISIKQSEPLHLGSLEKSNKRTIYKYIHPDGAKSCQLLMGLTLLDPNNIWNTMPTHTHPRRIESYYYFDIPDDEVVFHFMGEPSETRHLIVRSDQAVISPSWSIHAGVGTNNYSFIWCMAGENQKFADMDGIPMSDLK